MLPVVIIVLLEIGLRVFQYGGNSALFVSAPDELANYKMCNWDVARRYFFMQSTIPNPSKDLFLKKKPENGYRIFVLGGSTAAGYPYGDNVMFSRILYYRLSDAFPDKLIEVVNTAMSAINSYALLDFMDDILANKPDAILIYAGHNEFYGALGVASMESLLRTFSSFKHRFTTGEEIAAMLFGMKNVIMKYGSLYACFKAGFINNGESILPAITEFVEELSSVFNCRSNSLLPSPAKGSACKRINLFLRWMVRRDDVDPGGWDDIPPSELVIPLDTHMHKICLAFGFTKRKQADMKTALEITDAFRKIAPHDPVRYDFSLTRLGIREDMNITSFLDEYDTRTAVQHNRKSAYETC